MQNQNNNEYEGYGLFKDIDDEDLRTRNRAIIMGNITELHLSPSGLSKKGENLLSGYFGEIPEEERALTFVAYLGQLKLMGINAEPIVAVAAR